MVARGTLAHCRSFHALVANTLLGPPCILQLGVPPFHDKIGGVGDTISAGALFAMVMCAIASWFGPAPAASECVSSLTR